MSLPVFHVAAFTSKLFAGNPAAVCPLAGWLDDGLLQAVASETNLSETAYFVARGDHYELRWFTPCCEVKLCGHATLASAFVLLQILETGRDWVRFETRFSGALTVSREGDGLAMDFPPSALDVRRSPCGFDPSFGQRSLGGPQNRRQLLRDLCVARRGQAYPSRLSVARTTSSRRSRHHGSRRRY
jgi:hypothetical protein